jgi:2-haloacid dehalogenase
MIKYVLFDMDDTLLDFGKSEAAAIKRTFESIGIPATPEIIARYSEINSAHWARLERKEITREQVLIGRFDTFFRELGVKNVPSEMVQACYEHLLSIGHYFIEGAPELLESLNEKYDLYVVSNGNTSVQDGRIESAGIAHYFKNIFISERLGADKPSKEFFDLAFSHISGFERDKAIIIGDRLQSDILGGINAGIKTCWFNRKHLPADPAIPADYEIHALAELPELLEKI